ncbi:MAG: hypothetical protein ACRDGA_13260, partial [Bacteroidota bacterium]
MSAAVTVPSKFFAGGADAHPKSIRQSMPARLASPKLKRGERDGSAERAVNAWFILQRPTLHLFPESLIVVIHL